MKIISYLFYLSAICSLVAVNKYLLIASMIIGILSVAAYLIKTFSHNPIRIFLLIYLCFQIVSMGFSIHGINNPSVYQDRSYEITRGHFYAAYMLYALFLYYIIIRLVKRFSFIWWAFFCVLVVKILQFILPFFPFWDDFNTLSYYADSYYIVNRILSYMTFIAYFLLRISIGYELRPKSLKQ